MRKKYFDFVKNNFLFSLILGFAIVIRLVAIDVVPPSLNWDEVSHGYNAFSILRTGKDEWGQALPIVFRAYGDYKLPVYIYLTVPSVALFGLNAFALRLPSVLAGIGTVIFTYLFLKAMFKDKVIATLSALLVAVEPWSLFLSRGAFEANLGLFFFVAGTYFFIAGVKNNKRLIWSSFLFGLSVWTYNSYRIFTPLMLFVLTLLYKKELVSIWIKQRKYISYCLLLIVLFFIPMLWQLSNISGQARYGWVAILDEGAIARINELRSTSALDPSISRLIFNKGTFFLYRFSQNYLSHLSGDFLFFKGGSHYQFSLPQHGLISVVNAPLFIIGIFVLIKKRTRETALLLLWFYFSFVPSSLTREAPHVLRSITALPVPMVFSAFGLYEVSKWVKLRISQKLKVIVNLALLCYFAILTASFLNYTKDYFGSYRKNYSWAWQYGYKEVVEYAEANYGNYDKIIVTKKYGEPHEFFLFYGGAGAPAPWPWDPENFRNDRNLIRFYQSNWYWVDAFDKFYFVNDWQVRDPEVGNYSFGLESGEMVQCTPKMFDCLLVTSPNNVPDGWKKLTTLFFLNGEPAFEIYEN